MALLDQLPDEDLDRDQGLTEPSRPKLSLIKGEGKDSSGPKGNLQSLPDLPESETTPDDGRHGLHALPTSRKDYLGDIDKQHEARERGRSQKGSFGSKLKSSFAKRNKWKLIGAGAGIASLLAAVAVIFFFLLLFKSTHIKNLFIDYEFAKFNRAFNARIKDAIAESKPTGTADTTVPSDAPPAEQMDKANQSELEKLKSDPQAADRAANELKTLDQSLEGSGGSVVSDLALERAVPDESTKTNEEQQVDTENAIQKEVGANEQASKAPLDSIDEAAQEAVKEGGPKPTNSFLQSAAVKSLSGKMFSGVQKLQGPFVIATFACIARDIFVTGLHTYMQFKLTGLAQSATTNAKYADCQKLGKCTLGQVSTVSNLSDNSTQSFTQSAAYQRVSYQPVTTDAQGKPVNDLEEQMKPTAHPSGMVDQLLSIGDKISNASIDLGPISVGVPNACGLILKPGVQIAGAVINVAATAIAAVTGVIDFGLSDVAVAAGQSAAAIFATKAAKALAIHAAMHYGGLLFKGQFNPIQWGNMMGAGSKVLASDSCRQDGCKQLSPQENNQLALAIHKDQVDGMKKQSLVARLFDARNPYSAMGMTVDRIPTSPSALVGSINHFIASVFNFNQLMTSGGQLTLGILHPSSAFAATPESNTYGIPDFGFTDAEVSKWTIRDNSTWVTQHIDGYNTYKSKCISTKFGDALANPDPECSKDDDEHLHYRLYALDQRVTHDLVLNYNNQSDQRSASVTSAPTGPGNAQHLAQKILANAKVQLTGRLVKEDIQAASTGQPGSAGALLSATILSVIDAVGQDHTVVITALESGGTGHATNSLHYSGDAVDFDALDGKPLNGRDPGSAAIISIVAGMHLQGVGLGQQGCSGGAIVPPGFSEFPDTCNHLHLQVPIGTP